MKHDTHEWTFFEDRFQCSNCGARVASLDIAAQIPTPCFFDDRIYSFPVTVCLCGSTRFGEAFVKAQLEETLAGRIVLTIGCNMKSDKELFEGMSARELEIIKERLDWLHFRKIDQADEILVLNVNGYIGESTRRELEYAKAQGKRIRFLEPDKAPDVAMKLPGF